MCICDGHRMLCIMLCNGWHAVHVPVDTYGGINFGSEDVSHVEMELTSVRVVVVISLVCSCRDS